MFDDTLLVPGEEQRGVLMRPVLGSGALGAGVSAVVLALLIGADEFDALASPAWMILVPAASCLALGVLQSLWWRRQLGSVRYEADEATLRVMREGATIHAWHWKDVHKLRIEGAVGWYELIVLRAGTNDFPHLVVYDGDGRTKVPGVLVWGRAAAHRYESQLVELHRAGSP